MPANLPLKVWQPIAIYNMIQPRSYGLPEGLLCDTLGLEKTFEMFGSIYAVSVPIAAL